MYGSKRLDLSKGISPLNWGVRGLVRLVVMNVHILLQALTLAAQLVRVEKFIHRNIKKGNEFVKGVETGVLAPVLNIHDGARGEVYKLGQVLLRPAFGFSSALDFLAQGMTVQAFFILVHSHITPILFYISGWNMRTKHNFIFK